MKSQNHWKVVLPLTLFLASLAFIPQVIPGGIPEPYILKIPRTLWAGMAISVSIYAVLIVAMILSKED